MVRRLYEPYADPLMRIVQGVPMSWNPAIMTMKCPDTIWRAVWSPCSRFIAIDCWTETRILDAATLGRVQSLAPHGYRGQLLAFSAESRLLTRLSDEPEEIISWDLQTGVTASVISPGEVKRERHYPGDHQEREKFIQEAISITHSGCETMFALLFERYDTPTIITYNILSSASTGYYPVGRPVANIIWAHDKSIRFATFGLGSIMIWEVGFTLEHPATWVESLPTPHNFDPSRRFLFLPTCFRLAFILRGCVFVWDARHSKLLLSCTNIKSPGDDKMSFSSDGHFFACGTFGPEIYLWKDSPTGYTFHQRLVSSSRFSDPLLSPDGRSIIAFRGCDLQLWHTTDPTSPLFSVPTGSFLSTDRFVFGFSPDQSLAAAARFEDTTATVLDLRSGVPRLTIDAGVKIHGLGVAGSTVVVAGGGKIITWNLPQGDHVLNATMNIDDSIRTTTLGRLSLSFSSSLSASISPDFNHIAVAGMSWEQVPCLYIYNMTTGKYLTGVDSLWGEVWFSPDGRNLWYHSLGRVRGLAIIKDSESNFLKMEYMGETSCPPGGYPWAHPRNYKITDDGWTFNPNGKRLLWFPPHWRSRKFKERDKMWSGQFLALLHDELLEPVILEVLE